MSMSPDAQLLHDAVRREAVRNGLGDQFDAIVRSLNLDMPDFSEPAMQVHQLMMTVSSPFDRTETVATIRRALPYESDVVTVTAVS